MAPSLSIGCTTIASSGRVDHDEVGRQGVAAPALLAAHVVPNGTSRLVILTQSDE